MWRWLLNLLIAADQLANTLFGGNPDETISSRAGKAKAMGRAWGCVLCRLLDVFSKGHCERSVERDEA